MIPKPFVIIDTLSTPPGLIVWQGVMQSVEDRVEAGQAIYSLAEWAGLIDVEVHRIDPTTHEWAVLPDYEADPPAAPLGEAPVLVEP